MITGPEIRSARERAGLTQAELGARVGVSLRTVGNWERGATVPMNRMSALERTLAEHLAGTSEPGARLRQASDAELLAEIARRFARGDAHQSAGTVDIAYGGGPLDIRIDRAPLQREDYDLVADDAGGHDHETEDEDREIEP